MSKQSDTGIARIYGYWAERDVWLVTTCDDSGLSALMEAHKAKGVVRMHQGKKRYYWTLDDAGIVAVRSHLDALGYCLNPGSPSPEAASTAYRLPQVNRATQTEMRIYTVKEINGLIRGVIQKELSGYFWLQGEIVEATPLSNEKWFIGALADSANAKDISKKENTRLEADTKIKIVIWNWSGIRRKIQEGSLPQLVLGTKIRVRGKLDYATKYGTAQLVVEEIDSQFTQGELYKQKRMIVEKLQAMGIADQNRRLPMPMLPLRLAVFSSSDAAGYRDFKNKLEESGYPFHVTFFPVRVQGKDVEPMFMDAFALLEKIGLDAFDLGLILRGGGGMLDLEGFNNLRIGEYVARCPLKFLIAIGHERDKSVLDEIAEFGITPTDAAMKLVEQLQKLEWDLDKAANEVARQSQMVMQNAMHHLRSITSELCLNMMQTRTDAERHLSMKIQHLEKAVTKVRADSIQTLRQFETKLAHVARSRIQAEYGMLKEHEMSVKHQAESAKAKAVNELAQQITAIRNSVQRNLMTEHQKLDHAGLMICERVRMQKQNAQDVLAHFSESLKWLDPSDLYRRGFVTLSNAQGKMIKSVAETANGEQLSVRMIDGQLKVTVDGITPELATVTGEEK